MAPPTTLPRLAQLDPAAVATEVAELVAHHVSRLAMPLAPAYQLAGPGDLRASDLWLTVEALVRYAQAGTDSETDDPSVAADYARDRVQEVCSALYSQAGRPGTFEAPDLGGTSADGEPATPVGCVLLAAWTRVQLAEGARHVSARGVAALASVGLRMLRTELDTHNGELPAGAAKKWLTGREVKGI